MNYTLHQLQVFVKVAQEQSITKAAEMLHLTQPAVSIQLKNFQNQFEIPLVEVIGRKLYLTDFGKEVVITAEKILNEAYELNNKARAHRGELVGRLKISIVSTGKYVMPYFLSGFLKQHEGVELSMDVTNKTKVIESLENNEVDFSLVSILPQYIDIENLELMQNKLYVVTSAQNTFKKRKYDNKILNTLPLIYRESGSGTRSVMEKYIRDNALNIHKKMELTSNEAVKQAVIAGLGCSIMPIIGLRNELYQNELQIIPVKGFPINTSWQLIWLRHKKFSHVATSFLNYIRSEKSKIIDDSFSWIEDF